MELPTTWVRWTESAVIVEELATQTPTPELVITLSLMNALAVAPSPLINNLALPMFGRLVFSIRTRSATKSMRAPGISNVQAKEAALVDQCVQHAQL